MANTADASHNMVAVVIDDDQDVQTLLVSVLEAAGFTTFVADNGLDGVRTVLEQQPFLVTLDVNMPGIDGFEAARRIREGSAAYIIMISALDGESDAVLGLTSGADSYLTKPFRPRELRAHIDAIMRRSDMWTSPGASAAAAASGAQSAAGHAGAATPTPSSRSCGQAFPTASPAPPAHLMPTNRSSLPSPLSTQKLGCSPSPHLRGRASTLVSACRSHAQLPATPWRRRSPSLSFLRVMAQAN